MTKTWAILLVLFSTLLTSSGQLLIKAGAGNVTLSFISILTDYPLIIGIFLYAVSAVLLLIALRHGELSVLYPVIATSYIWVSLLSPIFFQEELNHFKWLGIMLIIVGVSLIGFGSNMHKKVVEHGN